jgi:peptide/nickel transport system substrate-binding protein
MSSLHRRRDVLRAVGGGLALSIADRLQGIAPAEAASGDSQLSVAQLTNPLDLDPWGSLIVNETDIMAHFIDPLTMIDRRGKVVPVAASGWKMVSPTEWVVTIRRGMKFHDSRYGELTAEDVKFSIDRAFAPGSRSRLLFPKTLQDGSTEVIDPYTLRWRLGGSGFGTLPNWMTNFHITSKTYIEGPGRDIYKQRPMGTGPYRFLEWQTNQRIAGDVFPGYWGPRPAFSRIVWNIITDPLTQKNALLTGQLDVFQYVLPEWVPEIQRSRVARLLQITSARMIYMVINASEPPLDNKLVRQALNYAVDKRPIVKNLFRGYATEMTAPMQDVIPEIDRTLHGYPYNPQRARDLLKQGGYAGQRISLGAPIGRYTLDKELGEAVANMLQQVGVNVDYTPKEWGSYGPGVLTGKAHGINLIGNGNVVMLPEFVFSLWLLPGGQGEAYTPGRPENWQADVARVSVLSPGNTERRALLNKLQAQALDWAPWIFLINNVDLYALSNRVEWQPYPIEYRDFRDVKIRS